MDFKFVCANTLIGLPKSQSSNLFDDHSGIIELSKIMSEYFSCNSQRKNEIKLKFTNTQKDILEKTVSAFGKNTGELTLKLTTWNPFTNTSNSWFDEEWMFGLEEKFDIVIANPPYVFSRENLSNEQKELFKKEYTLTEFKLNLYVLFVEKSFNLLNTEGVLSFIVPNNWLTLSTASKLRHFILTHTYNTKIVLHHDQVFQSASVETCLLIFNKNGKKLFSFYSWGIDGIKLMSQQSPEYFLKNNSYIFSNFDASSGNNQSVLAKIISKSEELGKICEVRNGVQAYTVGEGNPIQTKKIKDERVYHSNIKHDQKWLQYLDGGDINRYRVNWSGQFIKYGRNLSRSRDPELFDGDRILIRQIPSPPPYCIVASYFMDQAVVDNNCLIVKTEDTNFDIKYILAILNSRLISYWFIFTFGKLQRKTFPQFKVNELRMFPIISIGNISQQYYVKLVDKILTLKNQDKDSETKNFELQIDESIMDLYGLNEEEKEVIRNY